MAKSKVSSIDPMLFISANKFWLKLFGQWFAEVPILSFKYWLILAYQQLVLFVVFVVPIAGEVLFLVNSTYDIGMLAEGLYLLLSEFFTPVKVFFFLSHQFYIKILIEDLKGDFFKPTEPEHHQIIADGIQKGRRICITYAFMCFVSVIVALIIPIGTKFQTLPTSVEYPYIDDVLETPYYQLVFLLQIIYKPTGVIIYGALETLPPAFMASAITQLDVLIFNLENLKLLSERKVAKGCTSEEANKIIVGECLLHHKFILKFVSLVEKAYSLQLFVQFLLSGLVICLVGIQVLSIPDPMQNLFQLAWVSVYFVCMLLEVYLVCYFGDELLTKSCHLMIAAYKADLFDLAPELKTSIVIFMERCKRPMLVRAGSIFDVTIDTYANLLNWSYKAFAVMNRMKT